VGDRLPEFAAYLVRHQAEGEQLWDVCRRLLVTRALVEEETQAAAAKALGCAPRVINYYAKQKGMMPRRAAKPAPGGWIRET